MVSHCSSARYGTSLLFAQCVYLMFAGVYVAKEAVEHMLLSAGGNAHGHRHGGGGGAIGGDGRCMAFCGWYMELTG